VRETVIGRTVVVVTALWDRRAEGEGRTTGAGEAGSGPAFPDLPFPSPSWTWVWATLVRAASVQGLALRMLANLLAGYQTRSAWTYTLLDRADSLALGYSSVRLGGLFIWSADLDDLMANW